MKGWRRKSEESDKIRIIPYYEEFDEDIREVNPQKFEELKHHGDVIGESRCLAVVKIKDSFKCMGYGYLVCDENYHLPPEEVQGSCFLAPEYQAKDTGAASEVAASFQLLSTLLYTFDDLCRKVPEKQLILRTWCRKDRQDYMEYLHAFCFSDAGSMLVYVKDLQQDISADSASDFSGLNVVFRENKLETAEEREAYLAARGQAFGTRESHADLRYRLNDPDTRIFTAEQDGRIIAGMTAWRKGSIASEEGIFCIPEFQRQGIGEALMRFGHSRLLQDGVQNVMLTVYPENRPALGLYEKLGYRMQSVQIELHYQAR